MIVRVVPEPSVGEDVVVNPSTSGRSCFILIWFLFNLAWRRTRLRRVSFSAWAKGSCAVDVDGSVADDVGGVQRRRVLERAVHYGNAAELVDVVLDVDDDAVGIVDGGAEGTQQSLLT